MTHTASWSPAPDEAYLRGDGFSSGARIPVALRPDPCIDRLALLESMAKGRSVLHVGCTDHESLIERKVQAGTWLHSRLSNAASECMGVDLDGPAVLRATGLGFDNVVCADVNTTDDPRLNRPWGLAVLGEMVEHLDDPVGFLRDFRTRFHPHFVRRAVLTVPNATSWQNHRFAKDGIECINTDHRFWFTPYTLAKVASRAGWGVLGFRYVMGSPGSRGRLVDRKLARHPALRDTVVMLIGDGWA